MSDNQNVSLPGWSGAYGIIFDTANNNSRLLCYSATAREFIARDARYVAVLPAGQVPGPLIIIDQRTSGL